MFVVLWMEASATKTVAYFTVEAERKVGSGVMEAVISSAVGSNGGGNRDVMEVVATFGAIEDLVLCRVSCIVGAYGGEICKWRRRLC